MSDHRRDEFFLFFLFFCFFSLLSYRNVLFFSDLLQQALVFWAIQTTRHIL